MQQEVSFSKALKKRMPVETFIVLARDENGTDNPITVNWVMRTSIQPALMAVSTAHSRYSHGVIRQAGSFVIAAPSLEMEEETRFFGTVSGRDRALPASCLLVLSAVCAPRRAASSRGRSC